MGRFALGSVGADFLALLLLIGARSSMYNTGDIGRWNADGSIDILGRQDDQVKIKVRSSCATLEPSGGDFGRKAC